MLVKHADTFQHEFMSILAQTRIHIYLDIYRALNPAKTLKLTTVLKLKTQLNHVIIFKLKKLCIFCGKTPTSINRSISIYVPCRSTLGIMSVQFLLSFDACSTSHAVQVSPILLMTLLINVILCLPLARFPSIFPVIAKYSIVSFLFTGPKKRSCLVVIMVISVLLVFAFLNISGVASGYSRYSVNTLQFPEKIIICIALR